MKRFGQTIRLKPNALEAYTVLHAQPWTEVLEALAQIHIRNYSIFRFGLTLFAYLEYRGTDWEADQRLMASQPRLAKWAALTADMQQPLEVLTDSGLHELAYCVRGVIFQDLVQRRIRSELLGQDPLMREYLWHRVWELDRIEELPLYVLGVVDVALWDLAAKSANVPLYKLLGGYRERLPACASTVTFGSTEEFLDVTDQCLELGYPAIKLHAWGDAKRDAALCLALRDHVGSDVPLMYDGSAGFDLADAIHVGRALEEADYLWYEEPMREFSIIAYEQLSQNVRVPLLVAETSDGAHMNTADFIASGCATFVRTGHGLKGGVTGAMRIAHLADAFRLRVEVHGSDIINTHLCMAIPNTTYYESLVRTNPIIREARVDSSGFVHAPTGVGVGFEENWEHDPWKVLMGV